MSILFKPVEKEKLIQMPTLTLAHIGDCIFELLARSYVTQSGIYLAGKNHRKTVAIVSAKSQSKMADAIYEKLSEKEKEQYKRGRNSRPKTMSKNADITQYMKATGLEALFGWLYLNGDRERIEQLFLICIEVLEKERDENS